MYSNTPVMNHKGNTEYLHIMLKFVTSGNILMAIQALEASSRKNKGFGWNSLCLKKLMTNAINFL